MQEPPAGGATTAQPPSDGFGSGAKNFQTSSGQAGDPFQTLEVPLRSKPAAITFVRNRSGSTSFRVTVTIGGRQRRRHCLDQEDAEAQQRQWEMERIHGAAASRPKITALTVTELREAEAAMQILKGSGLTLLDCVRGALRGDSTVQKASTTKVSFKDALEKFETAKKGHISVSQADSYHYRGASFLEHIGSTKQLSEITSDDIITWIESKGEQGHPVAKKTWNNYRNDMSAILSWCMAPPRRWMEKNPAAEVVKYNKRSLGGAGPERLSIQSARELMAAAEVEKPEWVTYFAICLFVGIRPDVRKGEMAKLARCVARDGWDRYYLEGSLHLSKEITKTGEPRSVTFPDNLKAWIASYPPTPESLRPGEPKEISAFRQRFKVPPDGLRHTAVSAHVAKHGSFAIAAVEFGNSETIIRRHYFKRMSATEAEEFYAIVPQLRGAK